MLTILRNIYKAIIVGKITALQFTCYYTLFFLPLLFSEPQRNIMLCYIM